MVTLSGELTENHIKPSSHTPITQHQTQNICKFSQPIPNLIETSSSVDTSAIKRAVKWTMIFIR